MNEEIVKKDAEELLDNGYIEVGGSIYKLHTSPGLFNHPCDLCGHPCEWDYICDVCTWCDKLDNDNTHFITIEK